MRNFFSFCVVAAAAAVSAPSAVSAEGPRIVSLHSPSNHFYVYEHPFVRRCKLPLREDTLESEQSAKLSIPVGGDAVLHAVAIEQSSGEDADVNRLVLAVSYLTGNDRMPIAFRAFSVSFLGARDRVKELYSSSFLATSLDLMPSSSKLLVGGNRGEVVVIDCCNTHPPTTTSTFEIEGLSPVFVAKWTAEGRFIASTANGIALYRYENGNTVESWRAKLPFPALGAILLRNEQYGVTVVSVSDWFNDFRMTRLREDTGEILEQVNAGDAVWHNSVIPMQVFTQGEEVAMVQVIEPPELDALLSNAAFNGLFQGVKDSQAVAAVFTARQDFSRISEPVCIAIGNRGCSVCVSEEEEHFVVHFDPRGELVADSIAAQ